MDLQEFLKLNEIAFGVKDPKIRVYNNALPKLVRDLFSTNWENTFIWTGIRDCNIILVDKDKSFFNIFFNYYINLQDTLDYIGHILGITDKDLIIQIQVEYIHRQQLMQENDDYSAKLTNLNFTVPGGNQTQSGSASLQLPQFQFYDYQETFDSYKSIIRYYLIEYDNTKLLKI